MTLTSSADPHSCDGRQPVWAERDHVVTTVGLPWPRRPAARAARDGRLA